MSQWEDIKKCIMNQNGLNEFLFNFDIENIKPRVKKKSHTIYKLAIKFDNVEAVANVSRAAYSLANWVSKA